MHPKSFEELWRHFLVAKRKWDAAETLQERIKLQRTAHDLILQATQMIQESLMPGSKSGRNSR